MAKEKKTNRWVVAIVIIIILVFVSLIASLIIGAFVSSGSFLETGNVALIKINGPIVGDKDAGMFSRGLVSSNDIVELIESADKNKEVKAIIFEINSPGGSPVGTYEIADAIKRTNKTTVAYIREVGASGGYWVASATDHVFANEMSVTGSIGVLGSYLEFAGFLEDHNITYRRLVSGDQKDLGNPLKELSAEEQTIIQGKLDIIRDYFVDAVAENRGLPREEVDRLATGLFYLGVEAKDLGLIDSFGGQKEAIAYVENMHNITADIAVYKKTRTLADVISELFSEQSFSIGRGLGSALLQGKDGVKIEV